ncbi:hypothetical protein B0H13DRAFT_979455 [Mycena leptocephala]|nr:hypothetical protein B0H13DRAFT_979455 [Mycena leptocephala]
MHAFRFMGNRQSPWLGETKNQLRLLRPIRTSDWDRLRLYTRHVKNLSSGYEDWSLSNVFPTLSVSLPDTLFHNLHALHWHHFDDGFYYIHLFLRPTLKKISFFLLSDSASSLLPILATRCAKLTNITILSDNYISRSVSDLVLGLQKAEEISVYSLDQDVLEYLARLPTLKSLVLRTLPTGLKLAPVHGTQTFPCLRELRFTSSEIRSTTQFLGLCRAVPLKEFAVSFVEFVTAAETHDLLSAISAGLSSASLTWLSVDNECEHSVVADPSVYLIPPQSLRLLCRCTNLTVLSITTPLGFDFDDEDVSDLAPAWPEVVSLHLAACHSTYHPRTTLACLRSFAQHCPHLNSLRIPVDATAVPSPETDPRIRVFQQTLEALEVENSPISTPSP